MVDTSAVYALLDQSDKRYGEAKHLLDRLRGSSTPILLTNFLVAECHALIAGRLGPGLGRAWLRGLVWPVERVTEGDEHRAREIILTYEDKSFSYTDATTFALMERLNICTAFAFDFHFVQFGFRLLRD